MARLAPHHDHGPGRPAAVSYVSSPLPPKAAPGTRAGNLLARSSDPPTRVTSTYQAALLRLSIRSGKPKAEAQIYPTSRAAGITRCLSQLRAPSSDCVPVKGPGFDWGCWVAGCGPELLDGWVSSVGQAIRHRECPGERQCRPAARQRADLVAAQVVDNRVRDADRPARGLDPGELARMRPSACRPAPPPSARTGSGNNGQVGNDR
jgi:hypothetical protein